MGDLWATPECQAQGREAAPGKKFCYACLSKRHETAKKVVAGGGAVAIAIGVPLAKWLMRRKAGGGA